MPLNDFQNQFKTLMLSPLQNLENLPADFSEQFQQDHIPLSNRLKIYRHNIVGSLTDIMAATFPTILKLVGQDFFEGTARAFILQNPPHQGCLNFYGEGFAEFLESFEPAKQLPYLPDIVRLELAQNNAYYTKDDAPLTAEQLAKIEPDFWENTKLALRYNIHLLHSDFPLDHIQEFCAQDTTDEHLNIDSGPVNLMISRPYLNTNTARIRDDHFFMLAELQKEKTLGEALLKTLGAYPKFNIQNFLKTFIQNETFQVSSANTEIE